MEVELKYAVPDERTLDAIWRDERLLSMMEEETRSIEEFDGIYYDTADRRLLDSDIAYRIRKEGRMHVACLKWKGNNEGALHIRQELNVTLPESDKEPAPDLSVFAESEIGPELDRMVGDAPLVPLIRSAVVRRSFRIDTGVSIFEVSLDKGRIEAAGREEPVCELEIELYSGSREELTELGAALADAYGLVPEERSKFARGLRLLGK
ncbi:MAG: CYTH domain-containing protein [Clostridiales bacterium]|nr:CYTH domain-containing protein [Clostridiales bacterium]